MSAGFPKLIKNEGGVVTPILLLGPIGVGKEFNFSKAMKANNPSITSKVNVDHLSVDEVLNAIGTSSIKELAVNAKNNSEKGGGKTLIVFKDLEDYSEESVSKVTRLIEENADPDVIIAVSGKAMESLPAPIISLADNMHRLDFVLPPVLLVQEHESSPLHEYASQADFLAENPDQIDSGLSKPLIDSLSKLISALEGIKGGLLCQEACDRGMDNLTLRSLANFSRVYYDSENEPARSAAKLFAAMHRDSFQEPKYIEHRPRSKFLETDYSMRG